MSPPDQAMAPAAEFQAQLPQLFDLASEHQSNGRLEQAEQVYGQILGQRPQNPIALHRYGLLKYRQRKEKVAARGDGGEGHPFPGGLLPEGFERLVHLACRAGGIGELPVAGKSDDMKQR